MLNGKGLFIWHDDRLYLGDWKDNMMHGEGSYKWGDGRMFMGQYVDDKKSGQGIYLWADGRAYNGQWQGGKQHGIGFYIVIDNTQSDNLKIKKGKWLNGKRQEWREDVADGDIAEQKRHYQKIKDRVQNIEKDIQTIEETMRQLVVQQLGDKNNYDSSLQDLKDEYSQAGPGGNDYQGTPAQNKEMSDKPLEALIREALNYDSVCYK